MSARWIAASLLASLAALAQPHAQQPPPQVSRFAAEAELVTVDVSVVDADGRPVQGLEQKDFVVLENGSVQEILAFQAITVPDRQPPPAPARPAPLSTNTEPQPAGRTFVVVIDDLHLTHVQAQRGRSAVAQFLETGTSPGDRVMLVATGTDVWWHARIPDGRGELLDIVNAMKGQYPADSSAERISEWEAYRIEMHQDMDVALQVKRRFDSYGAAGQSRLSGPIPREDIARSSLEGIIDPIVRARASAVYNMALARNRKTLAVLTRALRAVADVPGRKAVVLVSQGFVHEPELRDARETVRASLQSNAPIYFVNTRGLAALSDAMSTTQPNPIDAQDTLLALADPERESEGAESIALDTGGFVIEHTNDLARGILQVSRESGAYYLLGYRPPAFKPDGRFRRIEVRLQGHRDGLTVKARRGYYQTGDTPPDPAAGPDPVIVSALDAPMAASGVLLRTAAYAFQSASPDAVLVQVTTDVDVRQFRFTERDGRFEDAMAFVIEVRDRKTHQRYRYDEKVEMSLHPSTRERLLRTWYPLSREFKLPPGSYRARVVVRDLASGRLGSVTHDFTVPKASEFRTSTPILSDLADSDGPVTTLRPVLIARRTFTDGSTLYCQYLVYGAALDASTNLPRVTGGYELRQIGAPAGNGGAADGQIGMLFKRAAPTPIAPAASGTLRRLHAISLAGAPPGDYELTLTIADELSNRTLTVREPLTIVPGM